MKIAIITGASSGMGQAFAQAFDKAESFDEVWLIARRAERLTAFAATLRAKARVIPLDLTQKESFDTVRTLLETIKPSVSLLVNGAGSGVFAAFSTPSLATYHDMIALNDDALVALTYLALPYLPTDGRILNICSFAALEPAPYCATYAASKSFALSFTRALGGELRHTGRKVLAICPFWTRTEFFDHAVIDDTIQYYSRFLTPAQVVDRAMKDLRRGKDISIAGAHNRMEAFFVKHLPHTLVMRIWCKQQHKPY